MAGEAIFISYRRDDTADVAGRVYDALDSRFGRERLFKDVDNLRPGADFGEYIKTILPRCRVVLILIGPDWVNASDEDGRRRLHDPHDWLRIEIEIALAADGLDVVPVLINGARMPRAEELPPSLHPMLRRHAATIRRDPDFRHDVDRLTSALSERFEADLILPERPGYKAGRTPTLIGVAVLVTLASLFVGIGVSGWMSGTSIAPRTPQTESSNARVQGGEAPTVLALLGGWELVSGADCPPTFSFSLASPNLNGHPSPGWEEFSLPYSTLGRSVYVGDAEYRLIDNRLEYRSYVRDPVPCIYRRL